MTPVNHLSCEVDDEPQVVVVVKLHDYHQAHDDAGGKEG